MNSSLGTHVAYLQVFRYFQVVKERNADFISCPRSSTNSRVLLVMVLLTVFLVFFSQSVVRYNKGRVATEQVSTQKQKEYKSRSTIDILQEDRGSEDLLIPLHCIVRPAA